MENKGVPILAADINGKLLEEKELRALNDYINKHPNLKIIEEIEGLISQVNEKVEDLDVGAFGAVPNDFDVSGKMNERAVLKSQALEEIDLFQKTTLLVELRKAFK